MTNRLFFYLALFIFSGFSACVVNAKAPTKHVPVRSKEAGPYANMTYDQIMQIKNGAVQKGNSAVAIAALERLMRLCTDVSKLSDIMIELAGLYYDVGQYTKSSELYNQFVNFYPGAGKELLEYAQFRAVSAQNCAIRPSDRDQTDTEKVISLADAFLGKAQFALYRDQVVQLRAKAYESLFDSEASICRFFVHRGQLEPCNRHLKYVRELATKEPALIPHCIRLELDFVSLCGDQEAMKAKRLHLIDRYADHEQLINQHQMKLDPWYSWLKMWA